MNEEEFLLLLVEWLPENPEALGAAIMALCALLSLVLPKPAEDAHPLLKIGHKIILILGMGAGKLRAAGKIGKLGKIAGMFGGKK